MTPVLTLSAVGDLYVAGQVSGSSGSFGPLSAGAINASSGFFTGSVTASSFIGPNEYGFEPAVTIRVYLDVRLAEVVRDYARADVDRVYADPGARI